MTDQAAAGAKGLAGVVVAQTQLSTVDGQIGKLIYHGYNIKDLAEFASFEEVIHLLWYGKLPNQAELEGLRRELAAHRALPAELADIMRRYPRQAHPTGVLRTAISTLGLFDPDAENTTPQSNQRKAYRLVAQMATIVAAWARLRDGLEPVAPRDDLGHAANFLYMLKGHEPDPTEVAAVDTYLVLLADHGMNASTFSARVTTSTQADMYSAITTALGTLKGPAHGGAVEKAMLMLMDIESVDNVSAWFKNALTNDIRIMGIGHRVYKVEDPRATVLRERARALAASSGHHQWYDIAAALEETVRGHPYFVERDLHTNVDFYSAVVLYAVGLPTDLFTSLFAISRAAGWCAHIMEQWADNRLIRPRGEYVGPRDLAWAPLEERA